MEEASAFLIDNENFSLFLLGNLETHGPKLISAPNSGNFKLIRFEGKVIAVFSLIRRGNLVIQSSLTDDWIMEKILCASEKESIVIKGLLGEWGFCQKFFQLADVGHITSLFDNQRGMVASASPLYQIIFCLVQRLRAFGIA